MGNIAKWRKYSKEELEKIVVESRSYREVARKLGYAMDGGGTIKSMHVMCEELKLDTSHFLGQSWNKDNYDYTSFTVNSLKKRGKTTAAPLIALRGRKCEHCGLTEWLNQPINLQIHHLNGDHSDNRLENLQLLCPNCHSYTENFAKKNLNKKEKTDEEFVQALREATSIHQALRILGLVPGGGNYDRARRIIQEYNIEHLK